MILFLLEKARVLAPLAHAVVVRFCQVKQLILFCGAEAREVMFPVWRPNLVTLSITRPPCVCVCVCVWVCVCVCVCVYAFLLACMLHTEMLACMIACLHACKPMHTCMLYP